MAPNEKRVFHGKVECDLENQVKSHFLENLWKLDIQYRIIFHQALWREKPWEIHFFEKSFRNLGPDRPKRSENQWKWSWIGSPWGPTGSYSTRTEPWAVRCLRKPSRPHLRWFWVSFYRFLPKIGSTPVLPDFFLYIPLKELPIYHPWWKLC